ncbi:hypothetical protein [Bacillus sp. Brlt_9]|uniref:hypothetical protein n=1 Tax=Bacillus sp. Brlt_9 TaxID=3110916 RepID=UPI003F7CD31D
MNKSLREISVRGTKYQLNDVVALNGYNEHKGYTAVIRIDSIYKSIGGSLHIAEYKDGKKQYVANAAYIRSLATPEEIELENIRRQEYSQKKKEVLMYENDQY